MKNILIGFLMATCMLLMIGATEKPSILETPPEELIKQLIGINDSKIGRYQGFGDGISALRYMLDTSTGKLYYIAGYLSDSRVKDNKNMWRGVGVWKELTSETDWIQE